MEIKVRFAPSPTGYLHVGGLRTALFNYLYAKKLGGKIVLRIEDTDQSRKVENAMENLISTFEKLNIQFDEGPNQGGDCEPYYQSKRHNIYNEHIKILLNTRHAYPCFCSMEKLEEARKKQSEFKQIIKYDRYCQKLEPAEARERMKSDSHVIRMKVPDEKEIVFYDVVRERVAIHCEEIDDQVLIKSDGFPTYHFANVVDDHLMGITHVLRGEEWLPSTPKHVLLYQFFDWKLPKFIHLPLLLNPDKSKLSKRQGDVAVEDYLKKGYLPETLLNFVALLGWHPKDDREIFTLTELEKEFSLKRIHKSGAVFDNEKLNWMNSQYLMKLKLETISKLAEPWFKKAGLDISDYSKYLKVVDNARQRVNTLAEMPKESEMFYKDLVLSNESADLITSKQSQKVLIDLQIRINRADFLNGEKFKNIVMETGNETTTQGKELFFPIRTAIYGCPKGPDLPLLFSILGKKEILKRISKLIIS